MIERCETLVKARPLIERTKEVNYRSHSKSCYNCRYFRMHMDSSYCLYLGRLLGAQHNARRVIDWARSKICDAWKKRPSTWNIYQSEHPLSHDKYIPRATQERFRK